MAMVGVKTPNWKDILNIEEAENLIDTGNLLSWKNMRHLRKVLPQADHLRVVKHIARRLSERYQDRLASEILIESLLVWIANKVSEEMISAFIDEVMDDADRLELIWTFGNIALSLEFAEDKHQEECFSIAVAILSEMSLRLHALSRFNQEELPGAEELVKNISTLLYSVSNSNSPRTRLYLVHYFGFMTALGEPSEKLNKVLNRFGYTVFDNLFMQLFDKKTESIALQFLIDNLPLLLLADGEQQNILAEILKSHMYKQPERFALFIDNFSSNLASREQILDIDDDRVKITWLKHLAQLFGLANELDHKFLAKDLILAICRFESLEFGTEVLKKIGKLDGIRPLFKELTNKVQSNSNKEAVIDSYYQFRSKKRGRKPSFSKSNAVNTLGQIVFLGEITGARAS